MLAASCRRAPCCARSVHLHPTNPPLHLQATFFMKAVLARANMENADLSDALMDRAVIVDANLRNAILQRTILTRSDLTNADVYGAGRLIL